MTTANADRNPVERLAEEFMERQRRGEHPQLSEYTAKYPELADDIRDLFPALVVMEELKPVTADATGAVGSASIVAEGQKLERLGDYRILREIGRGGMGIVYEAEQESLGRHVALKVLPAQALLNPQQQTRFQREAKAAARLHHTNIVPVYGVGEHGGMHYYVMQFIQGLGLDEVLKELKRLHQAKSSPTADAAETSPRTAAAGSKDLSAADFAFSLLSGQFAPPEPPSGEAKEDPLADAYAETATRVTVPAPAQPSSTGIPLAEDPDAKKIAHAMGVPPTKPKEASTNSTSKVAASSSSVHLPGQPNHTTLSESGRHYWQSVARIGVQVADALEYAHSQGILHRDIKPSNLLLDTQGTVWITDFGLAKAVTDGDNLTHTGDIVGTLRYMAPERFQGHSGAQGDLYSLGLTLYELLTQRAAHEETDRNKLIKQVTSVEPPRPRKISSAIPRDLETIVLKAIDREPARRYATAGAMAEDLRSYLDDKPIRARQVSSPERLWRWCRRNPAVASLTAAILVLLVGIAVASSLMALRFQSMAKKESQLRAVADKARENEEQARLQAERQKELAEQSFHQTLQAVDDSLTRISESKLLNVPGLQPLRKELLEWALKYYQGFLKQRADDPAVQKELATAYTRVAKITADIGSKPDALTAYQEAFKIRTKLLNLEPNNLQLQADMARHHQAVGRLQLQMDDLDAAHNSLQEASSILQRVIPQDRDNLELLSGFAGVLTDTGLVAAKAHAPLEALSNYSGALKLQRQLVNDYGNHPQIVRFKYALANQLNRTGSLQTQIELFVEGLRLHEEARAILQDLVRDGSKNEHFLDFQRELAGSYESIGAVLDRTNKPAEALKSYGEALPIRERLAKENPTVTDFQADVALTYFNVGLLQAKSEQFSSALQSYQRAIKHQQLAVGMAPEVTEYSRLLSRQHIHLAAVQRKLGSPMPALQSYREARSILEKLPHPGPGDLYDLACVRAAAQRQADANLAMEALRQAIDAGYRDLEHFKNDPELESLRSRDDFKALLSQLEERVKILTWMEDLEAAKAQAAKDKKDLFVYFTGSDWCPWCLLVKKDVFGKEPFINYATKHFVMVELDFPRYKPRPREYPKNSELFHKWHLQGFPSIILADPQGRPYGNLREGNIPDQPEAYVQMMSKLRQNRVHRDQMLVIALAAEGLERARLLDQALSVLPKTFVESDYGDVVTQILQLDPADKGGLRAKYVPYELNRRRSAVQAAMAQENCDWDGMVKQINAMIAQLRPSGTAEADVLADRARAEAELGHAEQAEADYTRAVQRKPDDPAMLLKRGEFYSRQGKADKAAADYARAIELKKKIVDSRRLAFAKAPQVSENRETLSDAYESLAKVQRQVRLPVDAAATAQERWKLWPGDLRHLYNVACELALCVPLVGKEPTKLTADEEAQRRQYADLAMDALRRAVLAEWGNAGHTKQDADLQALRGRDDFKALVSALENRRRFAPGTGELRRFPGHAPHWVQSVAVAPDGRRILSAGVDKNLRLWDVETGTQIHVLTGHSGAAHSVAISPDGRRAISGSDDKTIRLWDLETGKEIRRFEGHDGAVRSVAYAADGSGGPRPPLAVSSSNDGTIRLWDVDSGKEIRRFEGHKGPISVVTFSPDGRRLMSGGDDHTVRLWDVASGKEIRHFEGHEDLVLCVAISRDGRRGLSGTNNGFLSLWDLESGREIHRLEGHWNIVRSVAFSPDGRRALSGSYGEMILWDLETGRELSRYSLRQTFNGVAITPDGSRAVSATTDGIVRLWSLSDEATVARNYAKVGQWDKAEAAYRQAVDRQPDDPHLRLERGRFYARQGQWDKAIADMRKALERLADDAEGWADYGRCRAELGQWDQAAAACVKAMELKPEPANPRVGHGQLYTDLVQWEKVFAKVAERRPKDAQLWIARGRVYAEKGQWDQATVDFARAVELRPNDPILWRLNASLCLLSGDRDAYRQVCTLMLERFGESKDLENVAQAVLTCTQNPGAVTDPQKLVDLAQKAVAANQKSGWRRHVLGCAYYRAGQFDKAVECLREALRTDRDWDGQALNWLLLAMTYQHLDQTKEANQWLKQADEWFAKHAQGGSKTASLSLTPTWWDWVEYQILHAEADKLFKGAEAVSKK